MASLYIPDIGESITLAEDWTFKLRYETRNKTTLVAIGARSTGWRTWVRPNGIPLTTPYGQTSLPYETVTLPAGTVLKVDRVYIRKGNAEFSSITFIITKDSGAAVDKKLHGKRFWAKLPEVNTIEFEENPP